MSDVSLQSYAELRAYTGIGTIADITASGIWGQFNRDTSDTTSLDNGGTVIVDTAGRRWKRVFDGSLNVLWFGAVGNGIASDSTAINAALTYAHSNGGGTVVIPPGRYRLTGYLKIGANTTVRMAKNSIMLRDHSAGFFSNGLGFTSSSAIAPYIGGHSNITIEGGVLEGLAFNRMNSYCFFALGYGSNIIVRDIICKDMVGPGHSVDMAACDNVLFENIRFLGYKPDTGAVDSQECIQLDADTAGSTRSFPYFGQATRTGCTNITIRGCYFGRNPENTSPDFSSFYSAIGSHNVIFDQQHRDILIEGNVFDGSKYAGVRPWGWKNVKIDKNTFIDCSRCVWFEGPDHSSTQGGVSMGPVPCSRIILTNNHFMGVGTTHVETDNVPAAYPDEQHSYFTIANNVFDGVVNRHMYIADLKHSSISGNTFTGGVLGIWFRAGKSFNVAITGNAFSNIAATTSSGGGAALQFTSSGSHTFTISGNSFTNITDGRGISLVSGGQHNFVIAGNTFYQINGCAIHAKGGSSNCIISNNIANLTNLGIDNPGIDAAFISETSSNIQFIDNISNTNNTTAPLPVRNGSTGNSNSVFTYAGSPEGVVASPPGSVCRAATGKLYKKSSGTGKTGWVE